MRLGSGLIIIACAGCAGAASQAHILLSFTVWTLLSPIALVMYDAARRGRHIPRGAADLLGLVFACTVPASAVLIAGLCTVPLFVGPSELASDGGTGLDWPLPLLIVCALASCGGIAFGTATGRQALVESPD